MRGKRGPEGKEKGCVMYVGLVLHVAVLHLRCAVYLREPKCCKLHTLQQPYNHNEQAHSNLTEDPPCHIFNMSIFF